MSIATEQSLKKENAYRKERLDVLSERQRNRPRTNSFDGATRDAQHRHQLLSLIFAQLARQENELPSRQAAGDNTKAKERERMRQETTEVLRTTVYCDLRRS